MLVHDACPCAMTIEVIQRETESDENLVRTRAVIQQKQWKRFLKDVNSLHPTDQSIMTQIWRVRDELSMNDNGLILRGRCIVIPKRV